MAATDLIQAQRMLANEVRELRRISPRDDGNCTIGKFAPFRQARHDLWKSSSYIIFGIVLVRQTAALHPTEVMRCER